jgi:hypothetical protein
MWYYMRLYFIIVGVVILFWGCKDSPTSPEPSVEINILETVARNRIAAYVTLDTLGHSVVYFLAVGHTDSSGVFIDLHDPNDALIIRFVNALPPVKKYSYCQIPPVSDKQTGTNGRLFAMTQPILQGDRATLDVADFVGISQDLFRAHLTYRPTGWEVDSLTWRPSIN